MVNGGDLAPACDKPRGGGGGVVKVHADYSGGAGGAPDVVKHTEGGYESAGRVGGERARHVLVALEHLDKHPGDIVGLGHAVEDGVDASSAWEGCGGGGGK